MHPPVRASGTLIGLCSLWLFLLSLSLLPATLQAQESMLSGGWQLDREVSSLRFQSIKNGNKVETSRFANFDGSLDDNGKATLLIELNSVDTEVDLRNVRMRFLFFETFKFPLATVSTSIDEATLQRLATQRRITLPLSFDLDLHGVTRTLDVDTVLTMFAEDQIAITSASPVTVKAEDFGLMEGVLKLQDAANVQVVPSGSVSFDLTFKRNAGSGGVAASNTASASTAVASQASPVQASASALESAGNFSTNECIARFDTLSQTGAINFSFGSSELAPVSYPLLATLVDIVQRCPSLNILVSGHTDSSGSDALNMRLSSERAQSVVSYLLIAGVSAERMRAAGFGESRPLVPNDTRRNRARNRRIEFSIDAR